MLLTVSYTIRDEKGKRSVFRCYLQSDPENEGSADSYFVDGIQELGRKLNAIIRGAIEAINVSYEVPLGSGMRPLPLTNSDVEEGAVFQFAGVQGGVVYTCRVPTFDEDLVGQDGRVPFENEVQDFAFFLARPDENGFFYFVSGRNDAFRDTPTITENFKRRK